MRKKWYNLRIKMKYIYNIGGEKYRATMNIGKKEAEETLF